MKVYIRQTETELTEVFLMGTSTFTSLARKLYLNNLDTNAGQIGCGWSIARHRDAVRFTGMTSRCVPDVP